jgi:hypothetical protein
MATDTSTTPGIEDALRTRLLDFEPLDGRATLRTRLAGRLYVNAAPDKAAYPYGVLRLKNRRSDRSMPGRELAELEVMLFGRPRTQGPEVEAAADLCDQAMLEYLDATHGLLGALAGLRNTMPPFATPADADVVQVVLTYTLILWPVFRTQYRDV